MSDTNSSYDKERKKRNLSLAMILLVVGIGVALLIWSDRVQTNRVIEAIEQSYGVTYVEE